MKRSRGINMFGLFTTAIVLIVVLATKFTQGAYMAIIAMLLLFILMKAIKRHYSRVSSELQVEDDVQMALPARTHAIVLVSKIHKPTLRAISYARATRPSSIEAITVSADADETEALRLQWEKMEIPIPLRVLASPYREIVRPIMDHVKSIHREGPRDVVTVFIPDYVVGHWW